MYRGSIQAFQACGPGSIPGGRTIKRGSFGGPFISNIVKIPEEVIEEILKIIREHKELGYRTHHEFINESVRRRLEEIKKSISET